MNILGVEADWLDCNRLERLLKKAVPDMNICIFRHAGEALEFVEHNPVGAAFIDLGKSIHIPGYFLAQQILHLQRTYIIFTNYEWSHLRETFELRVSGYIRKPLHYEDIVEELQNLRVPLAEAGQWRLIDASLPSNHQKARKKQVSRFVN